MNRNNLSGRSIRHKRIRAKVHGTIGRPRLVVFRSLTHVYAQIIDDTTGRTLVASSDLGGAKHQNMEAARAIGRAVAAKAKAAGIATVVFDRGGYRYHGRVKALAEAARESGLIF